MPVSRKPGVTPPGSGEAATLSVLELPTRADIDAFLASHTQRARDDKLAKAQDLIYDAWERTTVKARAKLAIKALSISPLCADAFNLLANQASSPDEARELYARGLEAAELALGPQGFKEYQGHFWGFLETRPYMRARHGLALALSALGQDGEAIEHFRAMLKLNPDDNQGIRYLLHDALMRNEDIPGLKRLLAEHSGDWSPHWLYTRALLAFREGNGTTSAASKLLKDAKSVNAHVPAILSGARPETISDSGYVTLGGADEATEYVRACGAAWRNTPGAVEWLVAGTANRTAKPKGNRSLH